jgi:predicted ATPase
MVKSTGDGAFATFERAEHGVSAALAAQVALAGVAWPPGIDLRVRMGLHAGEATERDGDWYGPDVNRAARVMSVAHGGQIVCTEVVAEQARERFALVDLGDHRLRDLQSEVHLFQVDAPGLASAFPPLRSLDAYRSNLPYQLSSFVGRDEELRSTADRVRASRVVSIVGVGGVGKTRLALQVASEVLPHYPDGVWLCELAQVLDPADLPDAVAAATGYVPPQGVSVAEGLPQFLERKDLLLVLDNCEHLVGAVAAFVTATTTGAARLSVLVTSREALGIRGEHITPLASLEVPGAGDAASVLASDAGALFVARAGEARGELVLDDENARAVHDLCVRLDGIPLAIELAAAQTRIMSPAEIGQRLDKQFRLLTGGQRTSLERHQTLRAAIDWSYDLLSGDEHTLLDRLSVCVGGFDLDAAAAIAAGAGVDEFDAFDLLGSLVAKSLVERKERAGVTRYRILEMIRQYASEKLQTSGMAEAARDDHAAHYLALATALFTAMATAADYEALERLDLETANIAAAGRWLLAAERVAELVQFYGGLAFLDPFAMPMTSLDELGEIAGAAVEAPDVSALPGFPMACWFAHCRAFFSGDIAAYREIGRLEAGAPDGESQWVTLINRGTSAILDGDVDLTISMARRAVERARQDGDVAQLAWTLGYLATFEGIRDPEAGLATAEEGLAVARRTDGAVIRLYALVGLTGPARRVDPDRALEAAEECLRLDRTQRRFAANIGRGVSGDIKIARGEIAAGLVDWREALRSSANAGERTVLAFSVGSLGQALSPVEPSVAVVLAAIAESDAITHYAAFAMPGLARFVEERASEVDAARARAATMSYDDAMDVVLAAIDRLIAEHSPSTAAS